MQSSALTNEVLIIALVLGGIGVATLQATLRRKGAGAAEYFLAGGSVGWPVLAISFAVTTIWWIWSLFVGIPVGSVPMAWVVPGSVAVVGLLVLGVDISFRYRNSRASTIAAFLGERYGKRVALSVAVVSIAVTLLVCVPFTICVGSRLLHALLGWDLMSSALILIVVTGVFVIPGGYTAVMATHTAGGVVAGIGVLLLAVSGFYPAEGVVQRVLPEAELSWLPVIAGVSIVGFWFTCIDQSVVQRVMAARSPAAMRGGAALAALLVLLGVAAIAAGFDVVPADGARAIDAGVVAGFVGAAIIAFGIATLSVLFMSAATVFSMDIYRAGREKGDDAALVLVGRLANTAIVIVAIMGASSLSLTGAGDVRWMARAVATALPPVVAILLLGLLSPRMHGRGAVWSLVVGWSAGIAYGVMSADGVGETMRGAALTFGLSLLVCVGVSLATSPRGILGHVAGTMADEGLGVRKP